MVVDNMEKESYRLCKSLYIWLVLSKSVDTKVYLIDMHVKKDNFCFLLGRCPCRLGSGGKWDSLPESREICCSSRQWDTNEVWSFYEKGEAEPIHAVCASPWQLPCGTNEVIASEWANTIFFSNSNGYVINDLKGGNLKAQRPHRLASSHG